MALSKVPHVPFNVPLIDVKTGNPTPFFQRLLEILLEEKAATDALAEVTAEDLAALTLDELADVDTTGVTDGDVLTFDSGSGDWVAETPTSNGGYEAGPPGTVPTAASFTWVNQDTSTLLNGTGGLSFRVSAVNSILRGAYVAAPSPSWSYYMRIDPQIFSQAGNTTAVTALCGIGLRDSSDGEQLTLTYRHERISGDEQNIYTVELSRWNSGGGFVSTDFSFILSREWQWLRIDNNGTTLTFQCSPDGKNWIALGTQTIATYIDAVNQVGIVGFGSTNAQVVRAIVSYFSDTTPV